MAKKKIKENASCSTSGAGSVATIQREHITGGDNTFEIMIDGKKVVGFLEANGSTIDAVVVLGTYEVIKGASKKELVEKVRSTASKLAKLASGVKEDVLLPPTESEKDDNVPGQIEDEELMDLRRRLG